MPKKNVVEVPIEAADSNVPELVDIDEALMDLPQLIDETDEGAFEAAGHDDDVQMKELKPIKEVNAYLSCPFLGGKLTFYSPTAAPGIFFPDFFRRIIQKVIFSGIKPKFT